jgi:hypothetical protein
MAAGKTSIARGALLFLFSKCFKPPGSVRVRLSVSEQSTVSDVEKQYGLIHSHPAAPICNFYQGRNSHGYVESRAV